MTKVRPKEIARRIAGFSTPIGGIQWEPPEDERRITKAFVTFLEDRRVLFNPFHLEIEHQVIDSLTKIRETATDTLGKVPDEAKSVGPIKAIRAACRRFLDEPHANFHHLQRRQHRGYPDEADSGFFVALGELRATVGLHVAALAVTYDLSIDEELATILPAEDIG